MSNLQTQQDAINDAFARIDTLLAKVGPKMGADIKQQDKSARDAYHARMQVIDGTFHNHTARNIADEMESKIARATYEQRKAQIAEKRATGVELAVNSLIADMEALADHFEHLSKRPEAYNAGWEWAAAYAAEHRDLTESARTFAYREYSEQARSTIISREDFRKGWNLWAANN